MPEVRAPDQRDEPRHDGKGTGRIDLSTLPEDALVADIVYSPLETKLLAAAKGRGNRVVDGLGMLLYQAVPGFERWFGLRPEVTPELRAHVAAQLGAEAEPALEARDGLIQQHAEPIHDAVSASLCRREQLRFERTIHDVGHERVLGQRGKIDVERCLSRHAEARRVIRSPHPACAWFLSSHRTTATRGPKLFAEAFARSPVRLASRILAAPASISPCRMARAAPPAPSTKTGRLPLFQSGASAERCVMKPSASVLFACSSPLGIEPERVGGADLGSR